MICLEGPDGLGLELAFVTIIAHELIQDRLKNENEKGAVCYRQLLR